MGVYLRLRRMRRYPVPIKPYRQRQRASDMRPRPADHAWSPREPRWLAWIAFANAVAHDAGALRTDRGARAETRPHDPYRRPPATCCRWAAAWPGRSWHPDTRGTARPAASCRTTVQDHPRCLDRPRRAVASAGHADRLAVGTRPAGR